jgi:hypothetical protein
MVSRMKEDDMSNYSASALLRQPTGAKSESSRWKSLYQIACVAALLALATNLLDILLGFGETEIAIYGAKSAIEWFKLFEYNWFNGLYTLGILNIVYMTCLLPVYFAIFAAQRHTSWLYAALPVSLFFIGAAIYLANNAAIPMFVLASKYTAADTAAERAMFAAAGEAILARGEDFTPGSFLGLFLQGVAAIAISVVMLRGGIFSKTTAWIGIIGFSFLSIFIIWATFVPVFYNIAFYFFGLIGGLLALSWFGLVAWRFFILTQAKEEPM